MLTASTEDIDRIVREVMAQLGAASATVVAPAPAARPLRRLRFATATSSSIYAWLRWKRSPAVCREQSNCWSRPAPWSPRRSTTSCAARASALVRGSSAATACKTHSACCWSARRGTIPRCRADAHAGRHRRANGNRGLHDRRDRQAGGGGRRASPRPALDAAHGRRPVPGQPPRRACVPSWRPASRPPRQPYPPWGPTCWWSTPPWARPTKRTRSSAISASAEFAMSESVERKT